MLLLVDFHLEVGLVHSVFCLLLFYLLITFTYTFSHLVKNSITFSAGLVDCLFDLQVLVTFNSFYKFQVSVVLSLDIILACLQLPL